MIKLENVSKVFSIPHQKKSTLFHWVTSFGKGSYEYEPLYALKDINLNIREGEFLGVIGKNGSGKSTLLKVISRIYRPTTGTVTVNGDIFPMLELGVGFQPEFSVKENVYLYAIILGFTRREISRRLDAIITFAELERFIDAKLGTLSSGMILRLAFAIAIQSEASLLLVDEALAVGDEEFQIKCEAHFVRFKEEGKTVVLVSHDPVAVGKFCDRVIIMENGCFKNEGTPEEMIRQYQHTIT
jgi:ABC-type polysaccharide/polyol phosphate transport system ATPase subunit